MKNDMNQKYKLSKELVLKEFDFEDKRYDSLQDKAKNFVAFTSITLLLISGLRALDLAKADLGIRTITIVGIIFLILSIMVSMGCFWINRKERPNFSQLFSPHIINKSLKKFEEEVIGHYLNIVENSRETNNMLAKLLRVSMWLFAIGIGIILIVSTLLLSISILGNYHG